MFDDLEFENDLGPSIPSKKRKYKPKLYYERIQVPIDKFNSILKDILLLQNLRGEPYIWVSLFPNRPYFYYLKDRNINGRTSAFINLKEETPDSCILVVNCSAPEYGYKKYWEKLRQTLIEAKYIDSSSLIISSEDFDYEELKELFDKNLKYVKIAQKMNCSERTIRRKLKTMGLSRRKKKAF